MTDTTYNGWCNYETWNVSLWLNNEQGSYDYWRERAREVWNEPQDAGAVLTRSEQARYRLGEILKDEIEEGIPEGIGCSLYADLLGAALSEVHWNDVADGFLGDIEGYEPQ